MFQKMMTGALIAGIGAGLFAALLHFVFIQDLILLGERYEMGEIVHFGTPDAVGPAAVGHAHADTGHAADHAAEEPSTLTRNALTVGFTIVLYAAYGMLLSAGFAVATQMGRKVDATRGFIWGVAGFAAFQLSPAMGLAPELPGSVGADITDRQIWWWATVIATGLAAVLLAYGRSVLLAAVAIVIALAPHVVGAPHLDEYFSYAPAELGAEYAARVLGVGLAAWSILGWLAGQQWSRLT
ncbi:MAG: CbtA family protein [Pararhodobacter sp.]